MVNVPMMNFLPPLSNDTDPLLQGLNDEQKKAVLTTEGPLLILAGAGTGKTRVLTTRLAYILKQKRAWPNQILAVTFTNKAAQEIKERVRLFIDTEMHQNLWLGTFHSLSMRMLRRHASLIGLERDFLILDSDDQERLLKQILAHYPQIDPKKDKPKDILNKIQTYKDRAFLPHHLENYPKETPLDSYLPQIYAEYQKRLLENNACDFGDLILYMVRIFQENPDILAIYQKRFHYIMVDEYQDTNRIQYLWLRLLAQRPGEEKVNIACVGDEDQSIYSWRGADIGNILRFQEDFPHSTLIKLERNYRSTSHILGAASGLIAHNSERLGKILRCAQEDAQGEKILVAYLPNNTLEAYFTCDKIEEFSQKGEKKREMAILVRQNSQTRSFEEAFMRRNISYRVVGGMRFYERAEIRDAIAYMRVLLQPRDDLAFERIINQPKRAFGKASLEKLRMSAEETGTSLQITLRRMLEEGLLKGKIQENFAIFFASLDTAREALKEEIAGSVIYNLLEQVGYLKIWHDDSSHEAAGRLDNLHELMRALNDFPSLEEFLEHIALIMDGDGVEKSGDEDFVTIMTLHGAKGLEFNCVFLPGWEEEIFPSARSLKEKGLEEERRLAYVGITRARKNAIILHVAERYLYGRTEFAEPSRFLKELPEEHLLHYEKTHYPHHEGQNKMRYKSTSQNKNISKKAPQSKARPDNLMLGSLVRHARYGVGTIISFNHDHLTIHFKDVGTKRVLAQFVEIM